MCGTFKIIKINYLFLYDLFLKFIKCKLVVTSVYLKIII